MTVREDPPPVLYDIDGMPMAVRRDLAARPRRVPRVLCDEGLQWVVDDLLALPRGAEPRRYVLSEMRAAVNDIRPAHMRRWRDGDDHDSDWGEDAWYFCQPDDPDAVGYWELAWF